MFKVGDRVKYDVEQKDVIRALRMMRGTVTRVDQRGWISVHWDCDKRAGLGPNPNRPAQAGNAWMFDIVLAEEV